MREINKLKWEKFKNWLISDNVITVFYLLRIVWYVICFSGSSYYVISRWKNLLEINFYEGMNVEVVVFFIWVSLIIMPFIKKLDLFGIKVETNTDSLVLTSSTSNGIRGTTEESIYVELSGKNIEYKNKFKTLSNEEE